MPKERAAALPLSPTPPQLGDLPGSKLAQSSRPRLPSKQRVVGSNPSRDAFSFDL